MSSTSAPGIARPRETAAAPTAPGPIKAGQSVLLKDFGVGRVLATPGEPNGFPPARLQGHLIALIQGVQVRRPMEEFVPLRPAQEILAAVHPSLHERLRADPAYLPRVRKNALEGIGDDYFSPALAATLLERYTLRLPRSEAVLAAEYGAYLGKDEAWVRARVRSGKLQPEQVIGTGDGEDLVFKREPPGNLPPHEAQAFRDLLNTAGFGDERVAPRAGLSATQVRKIRQGGNTPRQHAARLRIAVEELRTLDALGPSFDRLHGQHWSLRTMAEASNLKKHQVWAFSVERTCSPEIALQLSTGFERLEELSQPPMGPLGFHRTDLDALLARLVALPLNRHDLLVEPLNQTLETLIEAARGRGYRDAAMAELAQVDRNHYPTRQGLNRRVDVARRMLVGLVRLLERESAPANVANGPGVHLSPIEESALRAEVAAAHFSDATLARQTGLSVEGIAAFRRGGGMKRVNAVRLRQAIVDLVAAGARRDAEVSPEIFNAFRQRVEAARANGWSFDLMHGLGTLKKGALTTLDKQSTCAYFVWAGGTAVLDKLEPVGRPFEQIDFGLNEKGLSALQARLDAMRGWPDHWLIPLLSDALGRVIADARRRGFTPTSLAAPTDTRSRPFAMDPGERRSLLMAGRMMRGLWAALAGTKAQAAS